MFFSIVARLCVRSAPVRLYPAYGTRIWCDGFSWGESPVTKFACIAALASVCALGASGAAMAKARIIDGGTVETCSVEQFYGPVAGDGATNVDIGLFDPSAFDPTFGGSCDATTFTPFSVNIAGDVYDSLSVQENGIVSFGGAVSSDPSTALSALGLPAFAPFFADGEVTDLQSLTFGYTNASVIGFDSFWLTWTTVAAGADSTSPPNIFQLGIVDQGGGDFDLIFNYEILSWDDPATGAQAGLTYDGNVILLPGAGTPGAYLGSDDTSSGSSVCSSASPATALACNRINDGSSVGGQDFSTNDVANGYYLFKFRDGELLDLPPNEIPLPAAAWLFLAGLGALAGKARLSRRRNG